MKSILTVCSEGLSLDRRSNNITVYNILEEISGVGFPLLIQRLFFYSLILKEDSDEKEAYDLHFKVSVDREKLFEKTIHINFHKKSRNRIIIEMGGLTIPKIGTLSFTLSHKGKNLGKYSILVKAVEAPKVRVISDDKTKK